MILPKPLSQSPSPSPTDPRIYRPKRIPVGIAIGFAYDDGLLFCADTKISANIKTNESKIAYYCSDDQNCTMTFAMSSTDVNFPRSAVESCWGFVEKMDLAAASIEAVHKSAEFALAEFYREHIFEHPDRTPGAVFLEILVGIWLRGETRLFVSHETLLTPVQHYECIGSGYYLAKYLIRQYMTANPGANSLQDAGLIASFAVKSAIDYDEHCDGVPEMLIIKNSGVTDEICASVLYPGDQLIESLQLSEWKFLHDLAQVNDNFESETSNQVELYCERVRQLNDKQRWVFDTLRFGKTQRTPPFFD